MRARIARTDHRCQHRHNRPDIALRESEQRFRQLAESVPMAFGMNERADGRQLYMSPAYEQIMGRSVQSIFDDPTSWLEAIHPDDRARVDAARVAIWERGTDDLEFRILRPDGEERWLRFRASVVRNEHGEPYRVAGLAEDVTERHRLEERLRRAQRTEAIGTLAGGIAHDFNNILGAILGNVELAQSDVRPDHPAAESLAEIRTAGERGKQLVELILAFRRPEPTRRTALALGPVVDEAVRQLRALVAPTVAVVVGHAPALPEVAADPTQVIRVLLNLGANAGHALGARPGRIEIRTDVVDIGPGDAGRGPQVPPGRFVRVTVADTGCGMDDALLDRIFDPFFTTKSPGHGTGLGLSVVHGIMRSHGGAVAVTSTVGVGSTFDLYFPVAAAYAADHTGSEAVLS